MSLKNLNKIFIIISIISLLYIIFKSEIYYNGNKRGEYSYLFFLNIILLIIFCSVIFFNEKVKQYFFIIFFSFLIGLYTAELFIVNDYKNIKIENFKEKIKIYEKQINKKYDTRTKFQLYNQLKKQNVVVTVSPANYNSQDVKNNKFFPLAGISNKKTIFCNENGYFAIYKSDRYGFNNPDEVWDIPNVDYIFIGDSFVHGACVNRPNDMSSIFRNISNKSVINLGYRGNGPLVTYASLIEYSPQNLKNIVWFYYEENDILDLIGELNISILKNYFNLEYSQNLKSKQNKIDNLASKKILILEEKERKKLSKKKKKMHETLIGFIKLQKIRTLIKKSFSKEEKIPPEFELILKKLIEFTRKNEANLYFVYLPEYNRYKSKNYKNTNYLKIKKILKRNEIKLIDVHDKLLKREPNPLIYFPFEKYGHYNEFGYKKITEFIYKSINQ